MTAVTVLERLSLVAPLGVRLRDEVTRAYVADRISAVVYPTAEPERCVQGFANPGGIFVFRGLPGLRDVENGSGDDAFWSAPRAPLDFTLEVIDGAGRYLPFRLAAKLPQRRILTVALISPPASPPVVQSGEEEGSLPLFSSASRAVPDGLGVFRAELVDAGTRRPAAWALVEAAAGEQRRVTGMADRQGRVMLPLFYPKPVIVVGSPGATNRPLTEQSWRVDVTIRYRRRDPVPDIPDLVDVLTQPRAVAVQLDTSPPAEWRGGSLRFGRELVPANDSGVAMPTLLITP
jgi:hypothetical protein